MSAVNHHAALDHLFVEWFVAIARVGGDEVDIDTELSPKDDLVVQFGRGTAVQAGEAVDKQTVGHVDTFKYVVATRTRGNQNQ